MSVALEEKKDPTARFGAQWTSKSPGTGRIRAPRPHVRRVDTRRDDRRLRDRGHSLRQVPQPSRMGPATVAGRFPLHTRGGRLLADRPPAPQEHQPALRGGPRRENNRRREEQRDGLRRGPGERRGPQRGQSGDVREGREGGWRRRCEQGGRSPEPHCRREHPRSVPAHAHRTVLHLPPHTIPFPDGPRIRPVLVRPDRDPHAVDPAEARPSRANDHNRADHHRRGPRRRQGAREERPGARPRAAPPQPGRPELRRNPDGGRGDVARLAGESARLPRPERLLVQGRGRRRRDARIQGHRPNAPAVHGIRSDLRIPRVHAPARRQVRRPEPPRLPRDQGHIRREDEPRGEGRADEVRLAGASAGGGKPAANPTASSSSSPRRKRPDTNCS